MFRTILNWAKHEVSTQLTLRFFYHESNISILLTTNKSILINISWNPHFSQISSGITSGPPLIQRSDICPPVSSSSSWLWVSQTKESSIFLVFDPQLECALCLLREGRGLGCQKEDHTDQGLPSWHRPATYCQPNPSLWYCPRPPGRCIFSKILSVQTFLVPFSPVPLRRKQPWPTMPMNLCVPPPFSGHDHSNGCGFC